MTEQSRPIPPEEYRVIAEHVPIVSGDLLVRHGGGLVLGKRTNELLKGEWLIPGGTVFKGETLREAIQCVAKAELGCDVVIDDRLRTYEHF